MPAIPRALLDSVVYLYPDAKSARAGSNSGGTAYLVGVPSGLAEFRDGKGYVYVVSNYHVAVSGGSSVVRINLRDGTTQIIGLDPSNWVHMPNGGDVAAVALDEFNVGAQQVDPLRISEFLTRQESQTGYFGPGDDVFMVGRFIDHDGGVTNRPAVRFGHMTWILRHWMAWQTVAASSTSVLRCSRVRDFPAHR